MRAGGRGMWCFTHLGVLVVSLLCTQVPTPFAGRGQVSSRQQVSARVPRTSRCQQVHVASWGEPKAFLLEEEKFLAAEASHSERRPRRREEKPRDPSTPSCREAGCRWAWASSSGAGPATLEKFPEIQQISNICLHASVKEGGRLLRRGRVT